MTFAKLAYISTSDFYPIVKALEETGFEDNYSEHTDSADEAELWVEIDEEKYVLDTLLNYGFLTQNEKEQIIFGDADTILFY